MWYLKQAAKKVASATQSAYNYSKNVVLGPEEPVDPIIALIEQLANSKEQVPTKRMDKLVEASYDMDNFDKISTYLRDRLAVFKYNPEGIRRAMNMMVLVNYLIKHGASGFIDDFRSVIILFKNYQLLKKQTLLADERQQMELENDVDELKQKARHIEQLLTDKTKLLKQKELAMLVKQKLKLYEETQVSRMKLNYSKPGEATTKPQKQSNDPKTLEQKGARLHKSTLSTMSLNDMMERYVWKYVDSFDDKLEQTTDKLMKKLDTYIGKLVDGEQPEKFGFDDDEPEEYNQDVGQSKPKYQELGEDAENDHHKLVERIQKQIDSIQVKQEDLLDIGEQDKPKARDQKLIDLL